MNRYGDPRERERESTYGIDLVSELLLLLSISVYYSRRILFKKDFVTDKNLVIQINSYYSSLSYSNDNTANSANKYCCDVSNVDDDDDDAVRWTERERER